MAYVIITCERLIGRFSKYSYRNTLAMSTRLVCEAGKCISSILLDGAWEDDIFSDDVTLSGLLLPSAVEVCMSVVPSVVLDTTGSLSNTTKVNKIVLNSMGEFI